MKVKLFDVINVERLNEQLTDFLEDALTVIQVDLADSLGYQLAEPIYAIEDTPTFYKSTVDGYAVMVQDTVGASEALPSVLNYQGAIAIGEHNLQTLEAGGCLYLNTGAMLPAGANGVAMIEQTEKIEGTNEVLVYRTLANHENVTIPGSDMAKGQPLFGKGRHIDERVQSVLASQGITEIKVFKKLEAVIVSSGNELIDYQSPARLGQIRDINVFLIRGLLEKHGIVVKETFLIKDDLHTYRDLLKHNAADLYITSGGSSQGSEDYTYDVFHELTNDVFCHGLAISPGKPTIVARKDQRLYLGLPGNPVSAYLVLKETFIASYLTLINQEQASVSAQLEHNLAGSPGKDRIVLVKLEKQTDGWSAHPIFYRSSNVLALSEADGYFVIKAGLEGVNACDEVKVVLF